jgi:ABC-type phosphate transport system substrate-binding protein
MTLRPSLFLFVLALLCRCGYFVDAQSGGSSIQIHGSGSSAISRCAWHVMETLSSRTKIPVRATYRSVGSGTGQKELVGNITHPFTDFSSSDNPLTKERYDSLNDAGAELIHLPVVMGAIALFHSVGIGEDSNIHLNLTSCLVARIFKGEIDDWMHPEIKEINPSLEFPVQLDFYGQPKEDQSTPIKVVHRALGSGSTFTFTSYLHKACPEYWEAELAGEEIEWPMAGSDRLIGAQSTSEILTAIKTVPYAIGYADAGFALDEGLSEVALRMDQSTLKEPFFLTSENAVSKDGLAAALQSDGANIPATGDADWSSVDTINQVGVSEF